MIPNDESEIDSHWFSVILGDSQQFSNQPEIDSQWFLVILK